MPDGNIHVMPLPGHGQVEHVESVDCVCGPASMPVKTEDGTVNWVITHRPGEMVEVEQ